MGNKWCIAIIVETDLTDTTKQDVVDTLAEYVQVLRRQQVAGVKVTNVYIDVDYDD